MEIKHLRSAIALICASLISTACTFNAWNKDFVLPKDKLYAPQFQLLELGMTKDKVIEMIGEPDQHIGAKMENGKAIETWEYFRYEAVVGPDQITERYQVTFTDGKLSSYDSSGDYKQQINIK